MRRSEWPRRTWVAADAGEHGRRGLAGVGAFIEPVHGLRAGGHVGAFDAPDDRRKRGHSGEDGDVEVGAVGDERKELFEEGDRLRSGSCTSSSSRR